MNKMDGKTKDKVRKKLVEGMCFCAEKSIFFEPRDVPMQMLDKEYWALCTGHVTRIAGERLPCFKPGVSDRLLMKKIIDPNMDNFVDEIEKRGIGFNHKFAGINLMSWFYYSQYGWWDEKCLEEAREYCKLENIKP